MINRPAAAGPATTPRGGKKPEVPPAPKLAQWQINNLERWAQQHEPASKKTR